MTLRSVFLSGPGANGGNKAAPNLQPGRTRNADQNRGRPATNNVHSGSKQDFFRGTKDRGKPAAIHHAAPRNAKTRLEKDYFGSAVRENAKRRPADATSGRPHGKVDGSNITLPPSLTHSKFSAPFVFPINLPRLSDNSLLFTVEEKILHSIDALDVQESELIEQAIAEHVGNPNPTSVDDQPSSEEALKIKLLLLKLHQSKNGLHSIIERRRHTIQISVAPRSLSRD
jgi:hypothetical protein